MLLVVIKTHFFFLPVEQLHNISREPWRVWEFVASYGLPSGKVAGVRMI